MDNDRGVFKAYSQKFIQSTLAVVVQISRTNWGGTYINMRILGVCMILAIRTPKFLGDFLITTGGGGGGAVNNVYHSVRLVQMARNLVK